MPSNRKPLRRFLLKHLMPSVALATIRGVGSTWHYSIQHRHYHEQCVAAKRPVVAAFLHARTVPLLYLMSKQDFGRWICMCSKSRDGDFMAQVEQGLGYLVVRGSSGGGGARALVEMIKMVKKDPTLGSCLAIDGSRGPRGVAQLGILTLVQKTNGLLLPVGASADRCLVWTRSWDRMVFPRLRARVSTIFGEPIEVPSGLDGDQLEKVRKHVESTVIELHRQADELTGFSDSEPLQLVEAAADA